METLARMCEHCRGNDESGVLRCRERSEGDFGQIDWDTTTWLKAERKTIGAKCFARARTLSEIASRRDPLAAFQAQTVSELRE
jgi:hypothetical protein